MKKISSRKNNIMFMLLLALMISFCAVSTSFADDSEGSFAPPSQEFLDWQKEQAETKQESSSGIPIVQSTASSEHPNGYIPIPVDLSHLASNPPVENSGKSPVANMKADSLPSAFDLRSVNAVSSVKNQNPYGTCWAHAAAGSMESNYMMQGRGELDLSEMHIAWFSFRNSDKSKAFKNYSSASFSAVMNSGGNAFYPAALFARLAGPASENDVPYGTGESYKPSEPTPESYTRRLRLRNAYYLSMRDTLNVNSSTEQRNIVKRRIMQNGSVAVHYYNDDSKYYKSSSGSTSYYTTTKSPNHAVQIIGWDDNYSRNNFKNKPSSDGAWLIKNSWGDRWYTPNGYMGDSGCFWMSYESYLTEGTSFVVEDVNSNMNVYDYDPLGVCGFWGYSGTTIYAANVFKSERNESLIEVGVYTADNNLGYEVSIYKGMSSMPSDSPVNGSSVSSASGTIAFAGYHTIALDSPVSLSEGEYFSVVVKFTGYGMVPVERVLSGFSDNAKIEEGSFFSKTGSSWEKGTKQKMNACIKAFTTTGSVSGIAPKISDSYPSDGQLGVTYSAQLTASGTQPITWSVSKGSLPGGLTLDANTGIISGTPTETCNTTFTVTAENEYGSDSKTFTMNIWELPVITNESFDCYAGYSFSGQLTLSPESEATWKAETSMPSGLKLNAKTGEITGKASKAGEYTVKFKATTSFGDLTKDVKITVYEKPKKPVFKTSKLANGFVAEKYLEDEDYVVVIGGEEYLNLKEEHFYFQSIDVTGTAPIEYSVDNAKTNLPDFMYLNVIDDDVTGVEVLCIGGYPIKAGTFSVTFIAENEATILENKPVTKTYKLVIKDRTPVIAFTGDSLPDARAGEEYSYTLTLSSGTKPITWNASGLPSGMTFSDGTISGTPTKAGDYKVTLTASNTGGKATLKVPLTVLQAPVITAPNLKDATTGKSYSAKISAEGTTPISWDISGLPDTLRYTYNTAGTTLTITGTPVSIDTYPLTITASNSAGSLSIPAILNVNGIAPKLKATLKKGTVDSAYTGSDISATGTRPIMFGYSISESDKAKFGITGLEDLGLSFTYSANEGIAKITGTPTRSVKSLPVTITADNAASDGTPASKTVKLTVAGVKPSFTEPADSTVNLKVLPNASVSVNFTVTGTPDITFSMKNTEGFTLTQTGGYTATLSGTAPSKEGKLNITVTATNADGKANKKVVIQTMIPPSITTASLNEGTLNKSYSSRVAATGSKTIKWSVNGALPEGISFSNGAFSGKPKEAGTFTVSVTASNNIGKDTKEFTLTITDPDNVTSTPNNVSESEEPELHDDEDKLTHEETKSEHESESEHEHAITFGAERDSELLSAGQTEMLSNGGYVIVKVLPEMKVSVSDMYEIDIELDEAAETGAKLFWFAFPKDNESTSDDEIAEFYDESGAEIESVPESHKITVSVWLTEGVTYEPVIAVKSEKSGK